MSNSTLETSGSSVGNEPTIDEIYNDEKDKIKVSDDEITGIEDEPSDIDNTESAKPQNEESQEEPSAIVDEEVEQKALTLTSSVVANVEWLVPAEISKYSFEPTNATFALRKSGNTDWNTVLSEKTGDGKYRYMAPVEIGQEYEYKIYFRAREGSNSTGRLFYIHGTQLKIDHGDDTSVLVPINKTAENNVFSDPTIDISNTFPLVSYTLNKVPAKGQYKVSSSGGQMLRFKVEGDNNIKNLTDGFSVTDGDGVVLPLVERSGEYLTFYRPSYVSESKDVNFDLPQKIDYKLTVQGYEKVTGTIALANKSGSASTGDISISSGAGKVEASFVYITFSLVKSDEITVSFKGLVSGSRINASTDNNATAIMKDGLLHIDLQNESSTNVTVQIIRENMLPITIELYCYEESVTWVNKADALSQATSITFDEQTSTFDITQILEFGLVKNADGNLVASSDDTGIYFTEINNVMTPAGVTVDAQLEIRNNLPQKYLLNDYEFNLANLPQQSLYRVGGKVMTKVLESMGHGTKTGSALAPYVYNFKAETGKTFTQALLEMYQGGDSVTGGDFSSIKTLTELPAAELTKIFQGQWQFIQNDFAQPEDTTSKHVHFIENNQYAVYETEQEMIDLASYHLLNNALYITLDRDMYPLKINDTYNPDLQFMSYVNKTDTNQEMMDHIFSRYKVLPANGGLRFPNISYVVDGNMVWDAYRPMDYSYLFDFQLIFVPLGVEGKAFIDSNQDGIYNSAEPLLEGIEVVLLDKNNMEVSKKITNQAGYFRFDVSVEGDYLLNFTIPDKYFATDKNADLNGSKIDTSGKTSIFTIDDSGILRLNAGFLKGVSVTYDANGGLGSYFDEGIKPGTNYKIHSDIETQITRAGYAFTGWNTKPDGSGQAYPVGESIVVSNDITLYAQWKSEPNNPPEIEKPIDPKNPVAPIKPTTETTSSMPKTGETVNRMLSITLFVAAVILIMVLQKNKTKNRE